MWWLVDTDGGRWNNLHHALRRHRHRTMVKGGNWGLVKGCGRKICNKDGVLIINTQQIFISMMCIFFFLNTVGTFSMYINHFIKPDRPLTFTMHKAWPHYDWDIHTNKGQTCIFFKSNHWELIKYISFSLSPAHTYAHKFWHTSKIFNLCKFIIPNYHTSIESVNYFIDLRFN